MTPAAQAPGRPPCAGASQADVSTTTTAGLGTSSDVSLVGSSGRSWTVRLRAAHLLVAVRLGEWWDDALACLPAGAGSGDHRSQRRGAGGLPEPRSMSRLAHPLGTPRAVAFRPSAVRAKPPARVPNCEGETSPLLTALMTTESAISGRNSFLSGCRCGRPRTSVRSGRVDHGGSAYRQPPPRRDSPPYRRRPRCTPGGGGRAESHG